MADVSDPIARWTAFSALIVGTMNAGVSIWKEIQTRNGKKPFVSIISTPCGPRDIGIEVLVSNTLNRAIIFDSISIDGAPSDILFSTRENDRSLMKTIPPKEEHPRIPRPKLEIGAGETRAWRGMINVPEPLPAPLTGEVQFTLYFDERDGKDHLVARKLRKRL